MEKCIVCNEHKSSIDKYPFYHGKRFSYQEVVPGMVEQLKNNLVVLIEERPKAVAVCDDCIKEWTDHQKKTLLTFILLLIAIFIILLISFSSSPHEREELYWYESVIFIAIPILIIKIILRIQGIFLSKKEKGSKAGITKLEKLIKAKVAVATIGKAEVWLKNNAGVEIDGQDIVMTEKEYKKRTTRK
jgi:hypothetical protein